MAVKTITTNTDTDLGTFNAGKEVLVKGSGTFDSATLKLQTKDDGTNLVDYPGTSKTDAFALVIVMPVTGSLSANTTGGGGSMDIDLAAQEVKSN